ncbi:hypothetical protein [Sphingomonas abietis]|uniref:Uncharacterized protein n=1 Tax=Sphingomonas abietis TaxID=3012344 RepID=A0ABY7NQK6_9SPHN|nr:hypothetical protein [Sphingomonas abietis]WBO22837.1 hypothetical protein PBT88_01400 [Sphingomonas abietis]
MAVYLFFRGRIPRYGDPSGAIGTDFVRMGWAGRPGAHGRDCRAAGKQEKNPVADAVLRAVNFNTAG